MEVANSRGPDYNVRDMWTDAARKMQKEEDYETSRTNQDFTSADRSSTRSVRIYGNGTDRKRCARACRRCATHREAASRKNHCRSAFGRTVVPGTGIYSVSR